MHLCSEALALVPVLLLLAKADASTNVTASPKPLEATPSTVNRPGTLFSETIIARDEERVHGIEEFAWGNKFAVLAAKTKQAVLKQDLNSQLELKVAWWRVKNVNPRKVYTKLKLDEVHENLLSNPWFHFWFKYVKSYNSEHPARRVSILDVLADQYDPYTLTMTLGQAKSEEDTFVKAIGATLQSEQMEAWSREITPRQLYTFLRSKWNPPHLLYGLAYDVWNTYFTKINYRSMPLFEQLYETFGDEDLPLLLIGADQPPMADQPQEVAGLATELYHQLEWFWLAGRVHPHTVFKNLKLTEHSQYLLDMWEIQLWMRYAEMFRERIGITVTLNKTIEKFFTADMVIVIINTALTDDGKKLADALKNELALKLADALAKEVSPLAIVSESL